MARKCLIILGAFLSVIFSHLIVAKEDKLYWYNISIVGLESFPEVEEKVNKISQLVHPEDRTLVASEGVLRKNLEDDLRRIIPLLHSYGFYDAKIFPEVEDTDEDRFRIVIHIDPGNRYTVNRITILVNEKKYEASNIVLINKKGSPVIHETILKDKDSIALYFKKNGHASVNTLNELVEINHETLFANITYSYTVGPKGNFGSSILSGLKSVDENYLKSFITWTAKDQYNVEKVNDTEKAFMDSGLFSSVLITPLPLNSNHEFDMKIELTEASHHHIKLNMYANAALTTETTTPYELGVIPKYTYDNVAGANEKFEIFTILSNVTQELSTSIKKPNLFFLNNTGRLSATAERQQYEPYKRIGSNGSVGFEYKPTSSLSFDFSAFYEQYTLTPVITPKTDTNYNFLGIPFVFRLDERDNKIYTTYGIQFETGVTPLINSKQRLLQLNSTARAYIPFYEDIIILAGWGSWNCLMGIDFQDSPLDKRMYLGGAENLRGYNKDSIGKEDFLKGSKDTNNMWIPRGGLSSFALGIEPRFKVYKSFGLAAFCDLGFVSEKENPFKDFNNFKDLFFDSGISFLYFFDFGPLRIDIAYPVSYPSYYEEYFLSSFFGKYQLNISFGQAF